MNSLNDASPVHESKRAVVQGESQDAHVVCVQDSMTEANTLPLSHKPGCADHYLNTERGLERDNERYVKEKKKMSFSCHKNQIRPEQWQLLNELKL